MKTYCVTHATSVFSFAFWDPTVFLLLSALSLYPFGNTASGGSQPSNPYFSFKLFNSSSNLRFWGTTFLTP